VLVEQRCRPLLGLGRRQPPGPEYQRQLTRLVLAQGGQGGRVELGGGRLQQLALGTHRGVLPGGHRQRPGQQPASPASKMTAEVLPAPAIPATREKFDTRPSLAPNTAARNQLEARARCCWASPATTRACTRSSAAMAAVASASLS
jgi:hypothetical protein